jgi:hypothetical protein
MRRQQKKYLNAVNNNLECAMLAINELDDLEAAERLIIRAFINITHLANSENAK